MKLTHHKKAAGTIRRTAAKTLAATALLCTTITGSAVLSSGTAGADVLGTLQDGNQGTLDKASDQFYDNNRNALKDLSVTGSLEGLAGSSIPNDPDGFYQSISTEVSGAPGDLVKTAPGRLSLLVPQIDLSQGKTTTIAYVSRNSRDELIPVTGTVIETTVPWNGPGPRPTLVIAPGTQGNADQCAPSRLMSSGFEYEVLPTFAALARGYNVAMTDLPGLGVPNMQHTYMNRVDQGQATLDMARAAINVGVDSINRDTPLAIWGYSQGGGAVSYTHLTLPTTCNLCRSRWSPYH